MKYPATVYAKAFVSALLEKPREAESITKRFKALLARNGDLVSAKNILRAAEKLAVKDAGGREVRVVSARPLAPQHEEEIRNRFSAKDQVAFTIDPSLVAGLRIRIDGEEELDATMRRKLNRLFRS